MVTPTDLCSAGYFCKQKAKISTPDQGKAFHVKQLYLNIFDQMMADFYIAHFVFVYVQICRYFFKNNKI